MNEHDLPEQGAKSETTLFTTWVLKLDRRDTLLVLQALGGRLDTPEKIEAASALCDRLTLQRSREANLLAKSLQFTADIVNAKQAAQPAPTA